MAAPSLSGPAHQGRMTSILEGAARGDLRTAAGVLEESAAATGEQVEGLVAEVSRLLGDGARKVLPLLLMARVVLVVSMALAVV